MSNGVMYIAYNMKQGADFVREAVVSVKSLKKQHPNLHTTLFTDRDPNIKEFDSVNIIKPSGIRVKQMYMYESPYDRTLFLDTDTKVINKLDGIFKLLDKVDIAATLDHERKSKWKSDVYPEYKEIPDSFSEFNSGVVLFKKSTNVSKFFLKWQENYKKWCGLSGKKNDQPSFRVTLWEMANILHIHTLPPEFNLRTQDKRDKSTSIKSRIHHWHNMYDANLEREPQKF